MRLLLRSSIIFLISLSALAQINPNLRLSPTELNLTAIKDGPPPVRQAISLVTLDASAIEFSLTIDGGAPGVPAPGWITVSPRRATTPARILVAVDASGLPVGDADAARIVVTNPTGVQIAPFIRITLRVEERQPDLAVHPRRLRLRARSGTTEMVGAPLSISNLGSGPTPSVMVSAESEGNWLRIGEVNCNPDCRLDVSAQTRTLATGGHLGEIRFRSDAGDIDVPVPLSISEIGPNLRAEPRGLSFEVREGQARTVDRTIHLSNASPEPLEWLAEIPQGSEWLSMTPTFGEVSEGDSDEIRFVVNSTGLPIGLHYALVRFRSLGRDIAQHVTVLLRVSENGDIGPTLSRGGFLFKTLVGEPTVNVRNIALFTSSLTQVFYQSSPLVSSSVTTSWLGVSPARGTATSNAPVQLLISASGTELPAGIYKGKIDISVDSGPIRSLNATLLVSPPGNSCRPTRIAAASAGLLDNFKTRVGEPTPLVYEISDNCGQPITNAIVTVDFSTGDPGVTLADMGGGVYAGVWVPATPTTGLPADQTLVRARISSAGLTPTEYHLTGRVIPDEQAITIFPDGVANPFWRRIGGALAPGMPVEIFGAGLAQGNLVTQIENGRLPTSGMGTTVMAGLRPAALYLVSPSQINAQLPAEMKPGREHQLIINNNGALTVAEDLRINPRAPGVANLPGGGAIAQDRFGNLITEENPVPAGEFVVIYLVGMGETNPGVLSGTLPPSAEPFARVVTSPEIILGGLEVTNIAYAGMTPFFVGLFQMNFQVPPDTPSGNQPLIIRQGLVLANETSLPIQ